MTTNATVKPFRVKDLHFDRKNPRLAEYGILESSLISCIRHDKSQRRWVCEALKSREFGHCVPQWSDSLAVGGSPMSRKLPRNSG